MASRKRESVENLILHLLGGRCAMTARSIYHAIYWHDSKERFSYVQRTLQDMVKKGKLKAEKHKQPVVMTYTTP